MERSIGLPGVDFATLSQRRTIEKIRAARRAADVEATATLRRMPSQQTQGKPARRQPVVITASPPPPIILFVALALFVAVAGVLTVAKVTRGRGVADFGTTTATSTTEWRDGVAVSP